MPVLPTLESSQSVFSNTTLKPQDIQANPSAFGAATGEALQGVGQAAQQVSGEALDIAQRQANIQRETNTNDLFYKSFFPSVTDVTQKYLATQGKDAVDAYPAYQQSLETLREQQRSTLTDPVEQRMFDDLSRRVVAFNVDGAARHATQQNQVYRQQTSDGMVFAAQQSAAGHWNDANAFNGDLASIAAERTAHGMSSGEPVEYTNAKIQHDVSASWVDRLKGIASAGDASTALTLLNQGENYTDTAGNQRHTDVRSQILPNDLVALHSELSTHAADQIGVSYGNTATAPPATSSRLVDAFMGQESSGGKNAGVSVNGARGAMQITQDTFNQYAKPGESIDNPADNKAVGARILDDYTKKYNGDPAKIAVAYFSGPGNVSTSGPTPWKNNTQDGNGTTVEQYVQGILGRMAKSQPPGAAAGAVSGTLPVGNAAGVPNAASISPQPVGVAQNPEQMRMNQEAAASNAQQAAEAHVLQLTGDPVAAKRAGQVAASTVASNTNSQIALQQTQQRIASGTVAQAMAGDPASGKQPITNYTQLVSDPVAYANFRQMSPEGQAAVTERLTNPGAMHMTQDSLNTYYKLKGMSADDPEGFAKQDLSQQFGKIPEAQLMQLMNIQTSISKRDTANQTRSLNWGRTKGEVSDIVASAIPAKDPNKADLTTQFYGKLQESIDQYHDQNQKYPDVQTTRKMAAGLVSQGTQGSPSMLPSWLGGNSPIRAFQSPDLSKFQVPVPDSQKPQLTASFQKVMGRAPTDDELTQAYTAFTLNQKKTK